MRKNFSGDKFLFVGKDIQPHHRGAHSVGKRFSEEYSKYLDYVEEKSFPRDSWPDQYKKIIFTYQEPSKYRIPQIKYILKSPENSLFYIRNSLYASLTNSICNGLSYYNSRKSHKNFIPYIPEYPFSVNKPNNLIIGFYMRSEVTPDAFYYLTDLLMTSKTPIDLVTCGEISYRFIPALYKSLKSWKHTHDTKEFFDSITHYLCPMSAKFEDPWPNMLMEAIQTKKQIIAPRIEGRQFKDGIDDLLSILCNGYHTDLSNLEKEYSNPRHGLDHSTFSKFYENLFNNDYENKLEYNKYDRFYDWVANEI